jgi:mRNA interferase MazF
MASKQGEVWLADLGLAANTRPVVILSQDDPQAPRALVTYVPLTTQNRGSPYEIELGKLRFLRELSVTQYSRDRFYPRNSPTEKTGLPLD